MSKLSSYVQKDRTKAANFATPLSKALCLLDYVMSYDCPKCDCKWKVRTAWKQPITCPRCKKHFIYERKQWKRIRIPLLTSIFAVAVASIVNMISQTQISYWVFVAISLGYLVTFIWWIRIVFTELKFEIKT